MSESGLAEIYARYVPRLIVERVVREAKAVDSPSAERFEGAILFADISGFTPLTEAFAARGPAGAEALTLLLNDYFGRMTAIVAEYGGDVLKFAGDALLALWRPGADAPDLAAACLDATACGLALQERLAGYQAEGHPLSLKVAVGVGGASVVHVGGQFNRWEFAIAGPPLNQVGRIGDVAERGDVLVSNEVWGLIRERAHGLPVVDDKPDSTLIARPARRVERLDPPPEPTPTASPRVPAQLEDALRGYLPAAITRRIMAGQTEFLGELRRLTILFVNLPDLDVHTPLEVAQRAFRALQKALYFPWEGSINKLSVDDKGCSLIAALGLPPFAHEDDAARGVQAAMAMHAALTELGQRCAIGVTTGRVYCGSVGGRERQEYTIMGDRVNLAARLMQHAGGGILCDAATAERAADQVRFGEPTTLAVKGKSEPLAVYRPETARSRERGEIEADLDEPLIGRGDEIARLETALDALVAQRRGGLVHVVGEAGVGKSRLAGHFARALVPARPVRLLTGSADAIEQNTSYFAWQQVLLDLFDLGAESSVTERRERVLEALRDEAEALELAPLLGGILPLEIPETPITRQMQGAVRAGNLQALLVKLLEGAASRQPLVLVLEDVHWMDSASWDLLRNVVQLVEGLLVVTVSRPVAVQDAPESLRALLDAPLTEVIDLERMDPGECVELVARRLHVEALPEPAARLVRERGEGHPFFSEEIGFALRDAGLLRIEDGRAAMAAGAGAALELELPDTIEGIITSRIDRLTPQQQLALKVASCIGRVFSTRLLAEIHPVQRDRPQLPQSLTALASLDLTPLDKPGPEEAWIFKHAITRQVAYDLMLYGQRKQLHHAIARWYEAAYAEDLAPYYPLLAFHWGRAEDDPRAIQYLELAATQALRANANIEVLDFIDDAERRAERVDTPPAPLRRARWQTMRGQAQQALGRLDEARRSLEHALALVGFPVPGTTRALVRAILAEAARQARHRRGAAPDPDAEADLAERRALAAEIVEALFLVYFFANDAGRMLWSTLRSTNLAETAGRATPTLVRCYADLALALQAIPMQRQVDYYTERAIATAAEQEGLAERAWAHVAASACLASTGRWEELERLSMEAVEINRQLGDMRRWEEAAANLALIRTVYGRFDEPEDSLYMPVLQAARKRGIRQTEGWGLAIWGMNLQYQQRFDQLDDILEQLAPWYLASSTGMDDIACLEAVDLLILGAVRNDDLAEADRWLEEGVSLLDRLGRPTQYRNLPCTYLLGEAALELWQTAPASAEAARRERAVRRVLRYLATYAGIFPVGVPRLAWLRGRYEHARGRPRRAIQHWRRCLREAERLEMRYDQMLAAAALAAVLPANAEERTHLAERAERHARQMGIPGSSFVPTGDRAAEGPRIA